MLFLRPSQLCDAHAHTQTQSGPPPGRTSAAHSVGPPVLGAQVSRLGRPHHQVLHVPPGQIHAAQSRATSVGCVSSHLLPVLHPSP